MDQVERRPAAIRHQLVVPFVDQSPRLAQLPEDDCIYLPIEDLLGPGFVWGGSEGSFNETNDHQWHSSLDSGSRDEPVLVLPWQTRRSQLPG